MDPLGLPELVVMGLVGLLVFWARDRHGRRRYKPTKVQSGLIWAFLIAYGVVIWFSS